MARRADLETVIRIFDSQGVTHGQIKALDPGLRFYVLAFRAPDNIQLELTDPCA